MNRFVLGLFCAILLQCSDAWAENIAVLPLSSVMGTTIHIFTAAPQFYTNNLVRGGTNLGAGNYGAQPNRWVTADVRPWDDTGTIEDEGLGVFITGLSILTQPVNQSPDPNSTVIFASPSDNSTACPATGQLPMGKYIIQVTLGTIGGARSGGALMVPIENGQFKYCWTVSATTPYPAGSSYGINFTPNFWVGK